MIDHVIITVRDLAASEKFYRKALGILGYSVSPEFILDSTKAKGFGFGLESKELEFFITEGKAITPPIHVAFRVPTRQEVVNFHQEGLAAGGQDNGAPELTPEYDPNYFSAYVLDPDGHNIEAVTYEEK